MIVTHFILEIKQTQLIKESIHKDSPAKSLRKCVHLVRDTLRGVIKKNDEHSLARVKGVSVHGLHFAFSNSYINRNPSYPTGFLQGFYATMKGCTRPLMIEKFFITGVSPVTLADMTSGFNVERDVNRALWSQP